MTDDDLNTICFLFRVCTMKVLAESSFNASTILKVLQHIKCKHEHFDEVCWHHSMDMLHVISCLQPSWLVLPIAAKQRTPLMGIRHLHHKAGITKTALLGVSCSVLSSIVLMCLLSNTKFWHCLWEYLRGKKSIGWKKILYTWLWHNLQNGQASTEGQAQAQSDDLHTGGHHEQVSVLAGICG